ATTVSGQGAIAETHANAVGVVGSNGGRAGTRAVVDGADVVLFVGCRTGSVTTERWRSPAPGVDILHMDCDPAVIGASYLTRAAWIGDAKTCLEGLNEILREVDEMPDFNGPERAAEARRLKEVGFRPLADSVERPIKPERVIDSLNRLLPPEAVVCADPGTPCPYFSAYWTIQQPGRHFISNRAHGALGYALGASIGAAIARPDAKIVCATGDGSFGMCVGEFETITRYKLPITTIVFSNSVFGWIKAGQKSGFGERYFSVDFNRTDHAAVAAAYGVKSWRVDDPAELDGVLKQAIAHDGPTLVDVIAQPLQDAAAPVSEWVA
ncbi:MAG: thiamine pyrophosphate-dependent enzyme, partial [Pseudomonadota bacterium]